MKKFSALMLGAMACAAVLVASCKKDDDKEPGSNPVSTINAAVVNGGSVDVDTVKAIVYTNGAWYLFATAPYTGGGFTITLPDNVDPECLSLMFDDGAMTSLSMSNRNVKVVYSDVRGYKSGSNKGNFYYEKWEGEFGEGTQVASSSLVYADGDVVITGTHTETSGAQTNIDVYNVSLKKGWNFMYRARERSDNTRKDTYTTSDPGAKWYHN